MAISFYESAPQTAAPSSPAPAADPATPDPSAPSDRPTEPDLLGGTRHTQAGKSSVSDYATSPTGSGASVLLGDLVGGKLAVELMDTVVPVLFVLMFRQMKLGVKKSDMQLSEKEKNTIAPVVEACMRTIRVDFNNPWHTLGISLTILYGARAMEHGFDKALDKKTAPPPKTAEQVKEQVKEQEIKKQQQSEPVSAGAPAPGIAWWTEVDLQKVKDKRRWSTKKCVDWLDANWTKLGGVLPW